MKKLFVNTQLGSIAVYRKEAATGAVPVIFLHGVYLDHTLWDAQAEAIDDHTVITLDMPWHGDSREGMPEEWTLDQCAGMLIEVLDALNIPEVIAIGHSWGSMTILRAAARFPERFAAAGLCNMPFREAAPLKKVAFRLQHLMLPFRRFYTGQAGKALFGKRSLLENPALLSRLQASMDRLSTGEIKKIDQYVIIEAADATGLIARLPMPALALKGEEDYVAAPPGIETEVIRGGHLSPMEVPEVVTAFTRRVIRAGQNPPGK